MALPSLAAVLMDPLLGMVDTAIVGHLGGQVLAGVGLGSILCGSFNWLFTFLSVLTIPKVAGYMAQGHKERACDYLGQALWVALVVGMTTMVFLQAQAPALIALVGGEPEMMAHALDYIRHRCIANPVVLTSFVLIGCFRGIKDAKTPLYAVLIGNIANLIMDVLFVYGLHMGAGGAALATSISQMLSCSILFGVLARRGFLRWSSFAVGPRRSVLLPLVTQGLSVSARVLVTVGVIMSSTSILARVDATTQAANEIIRQLWIFLFQFIECINISNQSIASTALGGGDLAYAAHVVKRHIAYAMATVSVAAAGLYFFQGPLVSLFTRDVAVIAATASTIPLVAACFPLDAMTGILDGTLTAAGQATWTAKSTIVISLLTLCVLFTAERVTAMSLLKAWLCLKLMTVLRLPLLLHRTFLSAQGPFARMARSKAPLLATPLVPATALPQPQVAPDGDLEAVVIPGASDR